MRVVVAESAATDLYSLTVYFGQLNPSATDAMVDRIPAAIRMLGNHPKMGHTGRKAGTREFVVTGTPYVLVYQIEDESLAVTRVLHTKQQWPAA